MSRPCGVSHIAVVTADLEAFRSFYEDTIGLETTIVFGGAAGQSRQAFVMAGNALLHVFEVTGYAPTSHGRSTAMFERGRLDHLGFAVDDVAALTELRDRLVAADASSGDIRPLGPLLSLRFSDPDGFEGEINCINPDFDPSTLRDVDEVVDPGWLRRIKRLLPADHDSSGRS